MDSLCSARDEEWRNFLPQVQHLNGLSFLWIRACTSSDLWKIDNSMTASKNLDEIIIQSRISKPQISQSKINKTVLLHERKRHIARRVANTHSAVLSREGGGVPQSSGGGGVPQSCPGVGVPQSWAGRGIPVLSWLFQSSHVLSWGGGDPSDWSQVPSWGSTSVPGGGYLSPRKGPGTSHWGTPWKGHGTSGSIMGWRWGTPPPGCGETHTCENSQERTGIPPQSRAWTGLGHPPPAVLWYGDGVPLSPFMWTDTHLWK